MSKSLPVNRLFQVRISTFMVVLLCIIGVIQFFASYGTYYYDHIPREHLKRNIFFHLNPKLELNDDNPNCNYDGIIQSRSSFNSWEVWKYVGLSMVGVANGTYTPEKCNPQLSVAILVTYRNRKSQLEKFIPYMHDFLRKQGIHYSIYVIEQQDNKPWNKGILYNIGARQAIADQFPCLIFHDVDLLPLDAGNLYACLQEPRHMSASIDKFRYVLTYDYLVGGALAIPTSQFITINGFSNKFEGWGGEDDDLAGRIAANNLRVLRYPPELSRYTMMVHPQEKKNEERNRIISDNIVGYDTDGLGSVKYAIKTVKRNRLYIWIGVKL